MGVKLILGWLEVEDCGAGKLCRLMLCRRLMHCVDNVSHRSDKNIIDLFTLLLK